VLSVPCLRLRVQLVNCAEKNVKVNRVFCCFEKHLFLTRRVLLQKEALLFGPKPMSSIQSSSRLKESLVAGVEYMIAEHTSPRSNPESNELKITQCMLVTNKLIVTFT